MLENIIIALISAITSGGLASIFTLRATRRKADADAMQSIQDVYQQTLQDQQSYIDKLRDTRDHLVADREEMRRENNELRQRLNDMDEKVRQLEHDVARNVRMLHALRPFLCGRIDCPNRTDVDLGKTGEGEEQELKPTTHPNRLRKQNNTNTR